jgi:hypothetical protein
MSNFCTLFDSLYLGRGLAMYESLKQHTGDFNFYIFAFDDLTFKILNKLRLEKVTIISLSEFETPELLNVKMTRTRAEYCWTCTSSVIEYVFENYNVPDCTYLDADLYFYNSPEILLRELKGDKNVLITEHRFSKLAKFFEKKRAGRFCVQLITFTDSPVSRKILNIWKGQCIDWCFDRYEDGKFGDQKYLDPWPENYNNVHILENLGGGVAPWNIGQFRIVKKENSIVGINRSDGKKFDLVFYHFHFVRPMKNGFIDIGWNYLSVSTVKELYLPYLKRVFEIEKSLHEIDATYKTFYYEFKKGKLADLLKMMFKRITKFNLIKLDVQ